MNGPHDLGGLTGFGPIKPEPDEPVFHAEWEKRALGVSLCAACLGAWTLDENRHAYELIPPPDYLSASYYEIWIRGLDFLLAREGFATEAELFHGALEHGGRRPIGDILRPSSVDDMLFAGPSELPVSSPAVYQVGDKVRTRNINPLGHTRLPRYARAKRGVVQAIQGAYAFPDDNAHGRGANPQWVYTVVFSGQELWGDDADPSLSVSIDAWESYLEPV
jgi:nitrile hydratase